MLLLRHEERLLVRTSPKIMKAFEISRMGHKLLKDLQRFIVIHEISLSLQQRDDLLINGNIMVFDKILNNRFVPVLRCRSIFYRRHNILFIIVGCACFGSSAGICCGSASKSFTCLKACRSGRELQPVHD